MQCISNGASHGLGLDKKEFVRQAQRMSACMHPCIYIASAHARGVNSGGVVSRVLSLVTWKVSDADTCTWETPVTNAPQLQCRGGGHVSQALSLSHFSRTCELSDSSIPNADIHCPWKISSGIGVGRETIYSPHLTCAVHSSGDALHWPVVLFAVQIS